MLALVGLLAMACFAYAPVRTAGFVYEDHTWMDATPRAETGIVLGYLGVPNLAMQSWQIESRWSAFSPASFHATNVAIHLLVAGLVYALVRKWCSPLGALAGAGLFLLHPIQTEAVAYVASRAELVSVGLILLAIFTCHWKLRPWGIVASVFLMVLAMSAKTSAVCGLPVVVFCWWCWFDELKARAYRQWFVLAAIPVTLMVIGRALTLLSEPTLTSNPHGVLGYAAIQSVVVWRYGWMLLWPSGLSVEHDWTGVSPALAWPTLALTLGGVWWLWRSRDSLAKEGLGALWIALALAPRFLVRLPDWLAEHHLYLAMVGVSLLVGAVVDRVTHTCCSTH